jgi:hypothetical protein
MRWWDKAEREPHRDLKLTMDELKDDHERLETQYRTWLGLYTNRTYSSFKPGEAHFAIHLLEEQFGVKLNVVQSCIDTLASKIGASRPRPQFLTSDGEWELKQRAKQLDKFVEGIFYECKIYEEARKVFIDAAILGTGFLKIYEDNGRVRLERVFPSEIVVDQQSTVTSDPRSMQQKKWVPLEVLKRMYPKHKKHLELISGETIIEGTKSIDTDLVEVTEAWHLPSGEGAGDGRHVICTDDITLFDEEWTFDYFPFVVLRWTPQPFGWLGQGLSEQLAGIQQEIDKLIRRIQNAMHLFSVAKVVMEEGAIEPKKLRNVTGDILEYKTGKNPPAVHMPSAINSEVFRHLGWLYEKAFELAGISQMSAASQKPADVESGIAIQTLLDIETQRFALLSKDWEEFFCEAARIVVDLSKKINSKTKFRSKWVAKDFVETIDWSDVNLRRDQYVLKVYPANLLPQTPYGRLAAVENLMRIGLISDPREAMALLDYPDLAKHQTLAAADIDDIDMVIGEILGKGKYMEPEPYQNLEIGMKRVSSALLRARIDRAPEDRILMLEQWLEDAERLIEVKEQEMQAELQQQEQMMAQQEQMMAQQQAMEQGPPPGPEGPPK